jgi:Tol biopolymer transport system component
MEAKHVIARRVVLLALAAGMAVAIGIQPAEATYPGSNEGRIAFGVNSGDNVNFDIYSVLLNGEGIHQLTDSPAFDACPAYSADGKSIAYCSGVRAPGGVIEIWVMKQNGTQHRQVTNLGGRATFPDFSPDGSRIAFDARLPGATNTDIFTVGADGDGLLQLTNSSGNDLLAAYSPDGSKIAFISDRTGLNQVWVMDADGSDQTQLTFDALFKDQLPDWSPDGSKIAYAACEATCDIWVMDGDGTDQDIAIGGPTDDFGPAWSPDGTQIAFVRFDDRTVYVANADGTGEYAVHPLRGQAVPAWQPRGERLDD